MVDNEITRASGNYKLLQAKPVPVVAMAIPISENPALEDPNLVKTCLIEIGREYPRCGNFDVSYVNTTDFGKVLQIVVTGR